LFEGASPNSFPDLWLRLRPGLAVQTHAYTQTGQEDSKFGMSLLEASQAIELCRQQGMPLKGLHFHQGSHFHDPSPLGPAIETVVQFMAEYRSNGWVPEVLCVGGGWGVPYHEDNLPHLPVESYVSFAASQLTASCQANDLPLPRLQFEPGRSLVANAGVSIYCLGAVKHTASRRWLMLDGGMADNIRPALYGAQYSALPVTQPARPLAGPAWLAGPYCESGDILIEALPMPEMQPGELVAVPVSGAYHISMSSNYNGACRPAALWLDEHGAHIILERETPEDLLRRARPLPA
jgi:diaminopimelate decarboxylase